MQTTANDGTEYTLRWRDHDSKLSETFIRAWEEKLFLDVTLACGNQTIAAHKLVLCACSPLLESLLCSPSAAPSLHPHPMLFFNDIPYEDLASLVEFMYKGAMTVTQQSLQGILNAAQVLQIRGLCQGMNESVDSPPASSGSEPINYHHQQLKRKRSMDEDDDMHPDHDDKDGTQSEEETDSKDQCPMMNPSIRSIDPSLLPSGTSDAPLSSEQQQHLATLLHLAAMQQGTPIPTGNKPFSHQPAGPSPVLRSRLVWDPAHISMLENWYSTETRYPSIAQSQAYANTLSQTQPQDPSGRSRGPVTVTAQNVSHWFQNRRRKDNHPEIEEKRVKKRSARMKRQSTPLDLTQQATPPPPPMSSGSVEGADQSGHQYHSNHASFRRDSDDEAGPLFIAEKDAESDAEHDDQRTALANAEHPI